MQTSFLFYGGLTILLFPFSIRFNVFDGTAGKSLVGNLASIGFNMFPGGQVLFFFYQFLAVILLAAASMTAFQDAQATEWRDVAIGEIPEALHVDHPEARSFLDQFLDASPQPRLGGQPKQTAGMESTEP